MKITREKLETIVAAAYTLYRVEVTDVVQDIFFAALRDREDEQVMKAFEAHIKHPEDGKFVPLPAHIIGKIQDRPRVMHTVEGDGWYLLPKPPLTAAQIRSTPDPDELAANFRTHGISALLPIAGELTDATVRDGECRRRDR